MISSLLKDSSGGFKRSIFTNDYENHIQDTNLTIVIEISLKNSFENLQVNSFHLNNGFILRERKKYGKGFTEYFDFFV